MTESGEKVKAHPLSDVLVYCQQNCLPLTLELDDVPTLLCEAERLNGYQTVLETWHFTAQLVSVSWVIL